MESSMLKISDTLNDKYEELFKVTSKTSKMCVNFNYPIELNPNRKYKLGMRYFSVNNSIRNITEKNNKIKYSKDNGATWIDLTIPPGSYEIASINNEINDKTNNTFNIEFVPVKERNKVKLVLKNGRQVDFTIANSIRTLLGFESKKYTQTTLAKDRANIENDINSINLYSSNVNGGYDNCIKSGLLYSIPSFTVAIGYRIVEQPYKIVYLPLNNTSITNISIDVKDDNGGYIDFGGEQITVHLHLIQV